MFHAILVIRHVEFLYGLSQDCKHSKADRKNNNKKRLVMERGGLICFSEPCGNPPDPDKTVQTKLYKCSLTVPKCL